MSNAQRRIHHLAACLFVLLAFSIFSAQAATSVRVSSFAYDPVSGQLSKEIIEPDDSNLCLVTTYTYDGFGNKESATTRNCNGSAGEAAAPSGDAVIVSRTTTTSTTYNTNNGNTTIVTTNAVGHSETKVFEPTFGNLKSLIGPNGLPTTWKHDSLGRKTKETRADNTITNWYYGLYSPVNMYGPTQNGISYHVRHRSSGQAYWIYDYFDSLGRKLLTSRRNFADTNWIDENNTWYDSNGRVDMAYLPYERGQFSSAKYSTASYDDLGRVETQTAPDGSVSTIDYDGLTTTVTNAKGQTKITVKNSQGQTATITDAQNQTVSYSYDPFGNLLNTVDPAGNTNTLTYDKRGSKETMSDPDMGYWTYFYNALGELVRQVDAKSKTTIMVYDKLGRMTSREEVDLISTWVYDTATKGIGKLHVASSDNGYSRTHSYDSVGRPSNTSTIIDNSATPYDTSIEYDDFGRVEIQTYPGDFAVKNVYNGNGYLINVVNEATPTTVYWTANQRDAQGNLTEQTYGNGIVTEQVFDPATGLVKEQYAGVGSAVQNMSYDYDSLGNLEYRIDANNSLTETYVYDTLNRVTKTTTNSGSVNTVDNYSYNAIGNIICKDDISACSVANPNYAYNPSGVGSVRPHAVASVTGSINGVVNPTFSYDNNGNMTAGAGRTISWKSFNMPNSITSGNKTASFWYGPEHQRTKEKQTDGSEVIVLSPRYDTGLHFEKKFIADSNGTLTGAIEYEYYLYASGMMFGQYSETTTTNGVSIASTEIKYYNKDHLGSIVATTNVTGAVTQRRYDVWGKRRNLDGAADPGSSLSDPDMYHGFTGHEHLDEVGLIHMNGRVYDPVLARFASADPTVQSPGNLQSYNRYSYGWNNPLNSTDPSGYSTFTIFRDAVIMAAATYACGTPCAVAVGAYQGGRNGGGARGAAQGAVSGYVSVAYPMTSPGGISWGNVGINVLVSAGIGCANASAAGGSCGRGAAAGTVGTVGGLAGLPGTLIAGCAVGGMNGGSCGEGVANALAGYLGAKAGSGAVEYMVRSQNAVPTEAVGEVSLSSITVGEKEFIIKGGTITEQSRVERKLKGIFSTRRGSDMLSVLESRRFLLFFYTAFTVDLTIKNNAYAYPNGNTIYVDPNFHPIIDTTVGYIRASTQRIMAHELGHAVFGTRDKGPNNMNNVIQNENPIMNELGQPSRTRY